MANIPQRSVQSVRLGALDEREAFASDLLIMVPDDYFGAPIQDMNVYLDASGVEKHNVVGQQGRWQI